MRFVYLGIGAGLLWLLRKDKKVDEPRAGYDYDVGGFTRDFDVDSFGRVNSDFEREFINKGVLDIDEMTSYLRENDGKSFGFDSARVVLANIERNLISEIEESGSDVSQEEFNNMVLERMKAAGFEYGG
jgi:hypothetical protein